MLISAWDLVIASKNLYIKHYKLFLQYTILLYIPSIIVTGLSYLITGPTGTNNVSLLTFIIPFLFLLAALFSFWVTIAFIRVIAASYMGRPMKSIKEELLDAKNYLWPAIFASILSGLAVLGGFILLIIPGIIFSIWFAFVVYSVIMDGHRGVESLRYSKGLVKGRWFEVFWRLLLPGLVYFVIAAVIQVPFDYLANASNSPIVVIISVVISTLVSLLLTPFITGAQTILYEELKKVPVETQNPTPKETESVEPPKK